MIKLYFLFCTIFAVVDSFVTLKIINKSGYLLDILWQDGNQLISQTPSLLPNNAEADLESFHLHKFLIRATNHSPPLEIWMTKGHRDETATVSYNSSMKNISIHIPNHFDIVRTEIEASVKNCDPISLNSEEYTECVIGSIKNHVVKATDAKTQLRKFQDSVSNRLRNYTCADEQLETTEPIYSYPFEIKGRSYDVNVLLNMTHAKIWYVDNFITDEECKVFESYGGPRLRRATVAAEDGTSVVSEHRKAQQAGYDLHHNEGEKDPVWDLHLRVLTLVNSHSNYSMTSEGQEGFTIIQYNPDDEYFQHCDGSCDNEIHVKTGRVATAVLYCKAPEKGGATIFTRSNILVKPKRGSATFFSYKGPDGRMDDGYTEHSGCPVLEGEKWITTFWMREGVTAEENWTKYDPSGVRILEAEQE